jgi:hypothetical protein
MAMAPATPNPEEVAEQMAEEVRLVLKEITITVTKDRVILSIRGATGDLTHKEWRIVKAFVDNIISELRAAARAR